MTTPPITITAANHIDYHSEKMIEIHDHTKANSVIFKPRDVRAIVKTLKKSDYLPSGKWGKQSKPQVNLTYLLAICIDGVDLPDLAYGDSLLRDEIAKAVMKAVSSL